MASQAGIDWPVCDRDSCSGIRLDDSNECLVHAGDEARSTELKKISQTGRIDARGVEISGALLKEILDGISCDPDGNRLVTGVRFDNAIFHEAQFERVVFQGEAAFQEATFRGTCGFIGVTFQRSAAFWRATFHGDVTFVQTIFCDEARFYATSFYGGVAFLGTAFQGTALFRAAAISPYAKFTDTTFQGVAWFDGVTFHDGALFDRTIFLQDAYFSQTKFEGSVTFSKATFQGEAKFYRVAFFRETTFDEVTFKGAAGFCGATFERAQRFGPVLAHRGLDLDGTLFAQPVQIEVSTCGLSCRRARFPGGVEFRLRWARVVLDETDLSGPSLLSGVPRLPSEELAAEEWRVSRAWERLFPDQISEQPKLLSLERANVAGLALGNVSLTDCRFNGVHNLEQLRLEDDIALGLSPARVGWEQRRVIAEESAWRANARLTRTRRSYLHGSWSTQLRPDWAGGGEPAVLSPGSIAGLYRALRKGREDAKDEPGAADFYYGEMEMRRNARGQGDSGSRGLVGRVVLTSYWLVSGYGLRAWRALGALIVLAAILTVALVGSGLAAGAPPQFLVGTVVGSPNSRTRIEAMLNSATPKLPPTGQRWTAERVETALEVTLDSIAFRTTDQPLTTAGIWSTDAARIVGPTLLVLALLAVRNRVKR
jgi:uncharacterized protein YjbI with pentapeptide repeats